MFIYLASFREIQEARDSASQPGETTDSAPAGACVTRVRLSRAWAPLC